MCGTCGCSDAVHEDAEESGTRRGREHHHDVLHPSEHEVAHVHNHHLHAHDEDHAHGARESSTEVRVLDVERRILARNDHLAGHNRVWLRAHRVLMLNLVSSPGSGKTTLLEKTIRAMGERVPIRVIEGDQATEADAARIRLAGAPAVQVNTGTGCHLDASMVARALRDLSVPDSSLLFVENVGNLVCPALFDLGEYGKVLVTSVTEGDDKPIKYPHMFRAARLLILNKIDLLPYVPFEVDRFVANAKQVNPRVEVLFASATRGDGLSDWYQWLEQRLESPEA